MFNFISHFGVGHLDDPPGRGSGRWEYGSGENPYQHANDFLGYYRHYKEQGYSDSDISKMVFGKYGNVTKLKAKLSVETKREQKRKREEALRLYDAEGTETYHNKSAVGRAMGINESYVRLLLDDSLADRSDKYQNTADLLKKKVDNSRFGMVDVGKSTEHYLGVTENTKKVALSILEEEGYKVVTNVKIPQATTQNKTTTIVLAKPEVEYKTIYDRRVDNLDSIEEFSPDNGKTWWTPEYPSSLDQNRVFVRYGDQGGSEKDGVLELRRGVEDLSLGASEYAQVRIAVGDHSYMKGMAIYTDDIPDGYDVIYNTNKKTGTKLIPDFPDDKSVFKHMKVNETTGEIDKDNPFGALIKRNGQYTYTDQNGETKLSPLNKLREEGDWDSWSKTLASQALFKQPIKLIKEQLDLTVLTKQAELDRIMQIQNTVVRKKMLDNFAGLCDSNAADLSAVGYKGQSFKVLLPMPNLKEGEFYDPNLPDGETCAIIRYPHGGLFEVAIEKNNTHSEYAKSILSSKSRDAIGIRSETANRLSGADFDGDTGLVIPLTSNKIMFQSQEMTGPLEKLVNWDNKEGYRLPASVPKVKHNTMETEMGNITNLITDMTVAGAPLDHIVPAVQYSMVVIDSEKHHLDYKQAYKDFNIAELKKTYQGVNEKTGTLKGASTILSRSDATARVPKRKVVTDVSKMTEEEKKKYAEGYIIYHETGETQKKTITNPKKMTEEELKLYNAGMKVVRDTGKPITMEVTRSYAVEDAFDLVRDKNNVKEVAYAEFSNQMKAVAREARKASRSIKPIVVNEQAKETYKDEVEDLKAQVRLAEKNDPKERLAQNMASAIVSAKFIDNPSMDNEHRQRARQQAITEARASVGAKKDLVTISDRQWEAIEAGAVNSTLLKKIVDNTDQEALTKRAMPGKTRELTNSEIALIKALSSNPNYTNADIAKQLGVSPSTVSNVVNS